MSERETMVCPHCDGTGKGPQRGYWGAVLTSYGHLPAECQNCLGEGRIVVTAFDDNTAPSDEGDGSPETGS